MTGVNSRTLSFHRTHTEESPAVRRVLLAFCLTSYSVCESVCQCERSRWRWVYNHGTVVVFNYYFVDVFTAH